MDWITLTASWFRDNESVLSGIAALVAIVGILLSPLGGNFKALFFTSKARTDANTKPTPEAISEAIPGIGPSLDGPGRPAGKPTVYIEPFTSSSEAASTLALELYEEVRRAVANFTGSTLVSDIGRAIYSRLLYTTIRFDYHPLSDSQIKNAELAARKAVALNDRSDFAQMCLGSYLLYAKSDFAGAKRSFMRSLEITPRYHLGEAALGEIEIYSGDAAKGIDLCKQDLKSQVLKNGRNHEAIASGEIRLGNYAAAVEMAEDAIHKFGEVTQTLIVLAAAAGLAGNHQVGSHAVASLKEKHPDITIDTLRRWPYKDDADWELFVSGLRKAGLQ